MSTGNNLKELFREYIEVVWNRKNLAALDRFFAADMIDHSAPPGSPPGLKGVDELFGMLQAAFPDYQVTIGLQVEEGDLVATRLAESGTHLGSFFGIPPTGRRFTTTSTRIMRFRYGKICEHWSNGDDLGMMQQLGVIETPGN